MPVAQRNAEWSSLARRTQYPAYLRPSILVLFVLFAAGLVVLWWFSPGKAQPVQVAPRLFGPNWDMSKFGRPTLTLDDGNTGVFTYSRSIYRQQGQGGLIFGGSTSYYITDVKFIGTYNLKTKETRIVHRVEHKPGGDGGGNLVLQGSAGQMLLLAQEPTRQVDFVSEGRWLLFNLKDSSLTELPLKKELKERNLDMGWRWLMKDDGTIMIVTNPLNPDGSQVFRLDPPYEILVRLPGGEYLHVATAVNYGFGDDEVLYDISKPLVGSVDIAYSIKTRTARELSNSERSEIAGKRSKEHPVSLGLSPDDKQLEISRKEGNAFVNTPVTIRDDLLR